MFDWMKKKKSTFVYNAEMKKADSYFGALLNTISTIRSRLGSGVYGISPDGKRDYNQLFGYGVDLSYTDYYGMYRRGGIANAVVQKLPKACWRDVPEIKVGETRILEDELNILKRMGFFKAMERADILNRIGNFSVLLIGVPDGQDLNLPLGSANSFDGMYFNPYNYDGIEILATDTDPASPRFGLPELYQVRVTNIDKSKRKQNIFVTHVVHWSRIVHLAEGALDSSIEGCSSLEAVWNALIDKDKVRGGSGEAYYRNARQKLALETDKDATLDTGEEATKALKENVENFHNGFEDVLRLDKMKANMLQPSLASPRDPFDIAVEEVSGTTGIPIRILTGKGGGQTVGTEDKASWNALVMDRSDQECSLWLLRGLSIMDEAGLLKLPEDAVVVWPVQNALTEKDKSEAMEKRSNALKNVAEVLMGSGADNITIKSILEAVGFDDLKLEADDLGNDDDNLDKDNDNDRT